MKIWWLEENFISTSLPFPTAMKCYRVSIPKRVINFAPEFTPVNEEVKFIKQRRVSAPK